MGRGVQAGGTHVYLWPIHVDEWQKPPHTVSNYLPIKIILKNKEMKNFSAILK